MRCHTVQSGRSLLTFQKNMLLSSSGQTSRFSPQNTAICAVKYRSHILNFRVKYFPLITGDFKPTFTPYPQKQRHFPSNKNMPVDFTAIARQVGGESVSFCVGFGGLRFVSCLSAWFSNFLLK